MEKVLGMIMWKEGLFPPLGAFFTFNGERPRRAHLVPAPVHAGNVYSKAHCRAQPVPNPWGSTHTHSEERSGKGNLLLGSATDTYPGKLKMTLAKGGAFPGTGVWAEAWGWGLEICLQGPKGNHLG